MVTKITAMTKPYTHLPRSPGVYLFKSDNGKILYIGKATVLRQRVASYFNKTTDWKVQALVDEFATIDYVVTQTEHDAMLLEVRLIKEHQPKFNVLLKSGNPLVYLMFTSPSNIADLPQLQIVRTKTGKGKFFGPFISKTDARHVANYLTRTFQLACCNKKIENGCLDFHIGRCSGVCKPNFDTDAYHQRFELAQHALQGDKRAFLKSVTTQIELYNNAMDFEKAHHLAIYQHTIENIFEALKTKFHDKKYVAQTSAVTTRRSYKHIDYARASQSLRELLKLSEIPISIDCFDISHLQGRFVTGSCIRFVDGKPETSKFRRFKIRTVVGQDDYACLAEVVSRRYAKGDLPDIILIDGGKGQLSTIEKLNLQAPIISLAKREERLFSAHIPEGLVLTAHTDLGKLLINMRDYAHHFAISYHKKIRHIAPKK
jgi:excinuclease ABC subunit C